MQHKRLEAKAIETHVVSVVEPMAAVRSALSRARADLLEQAVLANAEGWQSGPIEHSFFERGWDLAVEVTVWMEMTCE